MLTLVPEQEVWIGTNTDEVLMNDIILVHWLMKKQQQSSNSWDPK